MSNIEPSYRPPLHRELKAEGLYSRWVSYEATDEIIAYMTSYGSPFNEITNTFLSNNKQSLAAPVRLAISVYAYGELYPQRFGNRLDNALYQSAIRLVRCIAQDNKRHNSALPQVKFNNKQFSQLGDVIYSSCKLDVRLIIDKATNRTCLPDTSNGWYAKLLNTSNPQ
jgi:hypothetical protein